jgi:hypothetical protein
LIWLLNRFPSRGSARNWEDWEEHRGAAMRFQRCALDADGCPDHRTARLRKPERPT